MSRDGVVELGRGIEGASRLAATCDVVIVVDVLHFTTAVTVAVERGASVWPVAWGEPTTSAAAADVVATANGAVLAGRREDGGMSLSPTDMARVGPGERLVLPSPNGAACALAAAGGGGAGGGPVAAPVTGGCGPVVVAACLRNATAAATWAATHAIAIRRRPPAPAGATRAPVRLGVVAAGEATPGGGRRVAWEDDLGAGAVLTPLVVAGWEPGPGTWGAMAEWAGAPDPARRGERLATCPSGAELVERGWADDVVMCAHHDVTAAVPVLRDGAFVGAQPS